MKDKPDSLDDWKAQEEDRMIESGELHAAELHAARVAGIREAATWLRTSALVVDWIVLRLLEDYAKGVEEQR